MKRIFLTRKAELQFPFMIKLIVLFLLWPGFLASTPGPEKDIFNPAIFSFLYYEVSIPSWENIRYSFVRSKLLLRASLSIYLRRSNSISCRNSHGWVLCLGRMTLKLGSASDQTLRWDFMKGKRLPSWVEDSESSFPENDYRRSRMIKFNYEKESMSEKLFLVAFAISWLAIFVAWRGNLFFPCVSHYQAMRNERESEKKRNPYRRSLTA